MDYQVVDRMGDEIANHLNIEDAADTILSEDGHVWSIREENGFFRLFHSAHSRNSTCYNGERATCIASGHTDRKAALDDIWFQVVNSTAFKAEAIKTS